MAVEVGFVDGTIAATTPKGSAISITLRSSNRPTTPTVFIGRMKRYTFSDEKRFLVGEPGERFGLWRDGGGHRADDRVNLGLRQFRQGGRGGLGPSHQRASFADRSEIAIGLGRGLSHA